MQHILDKIIESYEWLLERTDGRMEPGEELVDIAHKWNMAKFNLEDLKQIRKLGEQGYWPTFNAADPQSSEP